MKFSYFCTGCVLLLAIIDIVKSTCVLESDFGFKINCAFKKSGLFRVRNLGGIKAHASLGFSLGDELGFEQSLTNLDPSRRRSVSVKNGAPPNVIDDDSTRNNVKQEKRGKQNRIMMRPPAPTNKLNPSAVEKLTSLHRRVSSTMQPIVVSGPPPGFPGSPTPIIRINPAPKVTMAKPMPMGLPPFKPLPPKDDLNVVPIAATKKIYTPLQVPQSKGPLLAYQSENYPRDYTSIQLHVPQFMRITQTPAYMQNPYHTTIQPFIPMPIASPPTQAISIVPAPVFKNSVQIPLAPDMRSKTPSAYSFTQNTLSIHRPDPTFSNFVDSVPHQVHDLATQLYPQNHKKIDEYNTIAGFGDDTALKFTKEDINEKIAEIAKAGNISMEAVEAAIALRQQQLLSKYANIQVPVPTSTTTTSTTTTTTQAPLVFQPEPEEMVVRQTPQKPKRAPTSGKVMNAPREYYPVGYEKNFDDHFQSKVDLPDTNFHCGDQKYFPGLYGDESLGCMVFHVCALTDDGLVMKSFLCPESTLFDQTILKCNWWFYVDCKNTRKLYDTNIPVSKSYQLMKALTFFSSYNKEGNDANAKNPEDITGIQEAITILENQDNVKQGSDKHVTYVTPLPAVKIYRANDTDQSPIYRGNRKVKNNTRQNSPREKTNSRENVSQESKATSNQSVNITETFDSKEKNRTSQNQSNERKNSAESKEKQMRYRQILRTSKSTTILTSTTTKPTTTERANNPIVEIIKQEIQPLEEYQANSKEIKEQKLIDLEPTYAKDMEDLHPVKRFYRSSLEVNSKEEKEMSVVNNEKVQIIRPTPSKYVGESVTTSEAIKKLDDAVLGRRFKKEIVIVTPQSPRSRS